MQIITEQPDHIQGLTVKTLPLVTDSQQRRWHGTIRLRPRPFGLVSYTIRFTSGNLEASLFGHLATHSKAFEEAADWQRHLCAGRAV
jgi:hypothetical protein